MALKFPSQNKLQYVSGSAISNDGYTQYGLINLPKDLSLLNRRGYASTDNKGVPWVFRCRFTLYAQDEDGIGYDVTPGVDFASTLKIDGCQNNWVFRNAAVKWHAARRNMWKKAGVKNTSLGSYTGAIRYVYDSASDSFMVPIDGDGDAFTGGTWDASEFGDQGDSSYKLGLTCDGVDEDTDASRTVLNVAHSYLSSRSTVPSDSNLESSEVPATRSHLQYLLSPSIEEDGTINIGVRDDVVGQGDNPPYEVFTTETLTHDITEPVELGRCVAGLGNAFGQVIVDIPFGLCRLRATHYSQADDAVTNDMAVTLEVLDIYPMQG